MGIGSELRRVQQLGHCHSKAHGVEFARRRLCVASSEEIGVGEALDAFAEELIAGLRSVGDIWSEWDVGRGAEERNLEERWVFDRPSAGTR